MAIVYYILGIYLDAQGNLFLTAFDTLYALTDQGTLRFSSPGVEKGISIATDGALLTINASGVRRLNPQGTPIWQFAMTAPSTVPMIGSDGTIYVGDTSGRVYAISDLGAQRFIFTPPATDAVVDLNIHNKVVYVAYNSNKVIAVLTESPALQAGFAKQARDQANSNAQPLVQSTQRMLRFAGRVALLDGRSASGYNVEIKDGTTLYCRTTTDTDGRYRCGRQTAQLSALSLVVTARGTSDGIVRLGSSNLNVAAGSANSLLETTGDVSIPITSLEVTGTLKKPNGEPAAGVEVRISGSSSPNGVYFENAVTTNPQGQYRFLTLLPDASRVASFSLRAGSSDGSVVQSSNANLVAFQTSTKVVDLTLLAQRSVHFSGLVKRSDNALSEGAKIYWNDQEKAVVDSLGRYAFDVVLDGTQNNLLGTLAAVDAMGSVSISVNHTVVTTTANEVSRDLVVDNTSLGRAKLALAGGLDFVTAGETHYVAYADAVVAYATSWTERWRVAHVAQSPLVVMPDNALVFARSDNAVVKLNPLTGAVAWAIPSNAICTACINAVAVASNGMVYATFENTLLEITSSGTRGWSYDLGGTALSEPVLAQDGTIYVKVNDIGGGSKLVAVRPNGTRAWQTSSPNTASNVNAPAISPSGQVIVELGEVYAINPDGTVAWNNGFGTASDYIVTPVILPNGKIIISRKYHSSTLVLSPDGTVLEQQHGYWWHANNLMGNNEIRYQMGAEGYGQSVVAHRLDGSELWRNGSYNGSGDFGRLDYPTQVLGMTNTGELITKNLNGLAVINTNSTSALAGAWSQRGSDSQRSGRAPVSGNNRTLWLSGTVNNTTLPALKPSGFKLKLTVGTQPECVVTVDANGKYLCAINLGTSSPNGIDYRVEFADGTLVGTASFAPAALSSSQAVVLVTGITRWQSSCQ